MSDDWVPQNKEQEFGFQRGKTFVQGFTDQINDLKAEIQRAGVQMERDRLDIDRLKRNEREYEKTAGKDTAGICKENADLKDALKIANG